MSIFSLGTSRIFGETSLKRPICCLAKEYWHPEIPLLLLWCVAHNCLGLAVQPFLGMAPYGTGRVITTMDGLHFMVNVHIFQSHEAIWDWTSKLISGRTKRRRPVAITEVDWSFLTCVQAVHSYTNSESIQANMYLLVGKIRLYGQTIELANG